MMFPRLAQGTLRVRVSGRDGRRHADGHTDHTPGPCARIENNLQRESSRSGAGPSVDKQREDRSSRGPRRLGRRRRGDRQQSLPARSIGSHSQSAGQPDPLTLGCARDTVFQQSSRRVAACPSSEDANVLSDRCAGNAAASHQRRLRMRRRETPSGVRDTSEHPTFLVGAGHRSVMR